MSHWRNTSNHAMVVSAVCETRIHIKDICFTAGLMENQTTPEVCNIRRPSPSMSMVLGEVIFMVMLRYVFLLIFTGGQARHATVPLLSLCGVSAPPVGTLHHIPGGAAHLVSEGHRG